MLEGRCVGFPPSQCYSVNQVRRTECRSCGTPKTDSTLDIDRALFAFSSTPSVYVLIKNLCVSATESDVGSSSVCHPGDVLLQQLRAHQIRLHFQGQLQQALHGYGVVEFESVPGATQVIGMASLLSVHGYHVLLGFANPYCIRSSFPRLLT